jgi:hypothetical protein
MAGLVSGSFISIYELSDRLVLASMDFGDEFNRDYS